MINFGKWINLALYRNEPDWRTLIDGYQKMFGEKPCFTNSSEKLPISDLPYDVLLHKFKDGIKNAIDSGVKLPSSFNVRVIMDFEYCN